MIFILLSRRLTILNFSKSCFRPIYSLLIFARWLFLLIQFSGQVEQQCCSVQWFAFPMFLETPRLQRYSSQS